MEPRQVIPGLFISIMGKKRYRVAAQFEETLIFDDEAARRYGIILDHIRSYWYSSFLYKTKHHQTCERLKQVGPHHGGNGMAHHDPTTSDHWCLGSRLRQPRTSLQNVAKLGSKATKLHDVKRLRLKIWCIPKRKKKAPLI